MGDQLEHIYRDYIAALNARRFGDLDHFVGDRLTYNGEDWTRDAYRSLLESDAQRIPDLQYRIQLLVVASDQVACRLWFDCSPQQECLGMDARGRHVSFAEHVFYRFRANRIAHVWSLIDAEGIRRQLSEPRTP